MSKLNIVLLTSPAAGKEHRATDRETTSFTQYRRSLRAELKAETELGLAAGELMDNGELEDNISRSVRSATRWKPAQRSPRFIFDGFPTHGVH
ncbi:MAG: hypothetical protein IPH63_10420 [Flavobacteriales bacterium]|nr:hypothetical protein [Flavobacteriales bacterium]